MAEENFVPGSGRDVLVAKVAGTPSTNSWAQAYNAGKLFAVLSLEKEAGQEEGSLPTGGETEAQPLASLGKDLLDKLQKEFFSLENKDLPSVKLAIETTLKETPADVKVCLVVGCISQNALYIFTTGNGEVFIKRDGQSGVLLSQEEEGTGIKSASGFLQAGDIFFLKTKKFKDVVSNDLLSSKLDSSDISEIAETLMPLVHKEGEINGAAACLIFMVQGEEAVNEDETEEKENITTLPPIDNARPIENPQEEIKTSAGDEDASEPKKENFMGKVFLVPGKVFRIKPAGLGGRRKLILVAAIAILLILGVGIFMGIRNNQTAQQKALFTEVYEEAHGKFEEGKALQDLNAELAHDNFEEAQKILNENKDKFQKNSEEEKKILDLLSQVNSVLGVSQGETGDSLPPSISLSNSPLLEEETKQTTANYFTQNEDNVYFVDANAVYSVSKDSGEKENLISNDDYWTTPGGIGLFGQNIYVLDKTSDQVLKFVASENDFTETDYFTEDVDLASARAMAVDTSIWVLYSNGNIEKFTRGSKVSFSISGVSKSLSGATRIYTTDDLDNFYILDNANNRVISLDKNGKMLKEYTSPVIKDAKDLEVSEEDGKIYILSANKLYSINL